MRRCNKTWLHPVSIKNIEAAQGLTDTSVSHVTTMRRASMTRAEEWRRGEDWEAGVRARANADTWFDGGHEAMFNVTKGKIK